MIRFSIPIGACLICLSTGLFAQAPNNSAMRERLIARFDTDGDGSLSAEEREALRAFVAERTSTGAEQTAAEPKEGLSQLYKPTEGPHEIEVVELYELPDQERGKTLQLRVSFPAEAGKYPLIVWSHGASGTKDNYQPLVRRWVSHGYVVVQANHSV
ncbi:MAG: hypothetical protein AAF357_19595 [Verrucomicrobiota bacterium]